MSLGICLFLTYLPQKWTYLQNRYSYKWTYLQNTVTDVENKFMVTGGQEGGINWEIGTDIYTLLYIKYTANKDLL